MMATKVGCDVRGLGRRAVWLVSAVAALLVAVCGLWEPAFSEGMLDFQPRRMVSSPTAGTLERAAYDVDLCIYPEGGVLLAVTIGLTDNIMIGSSYGGLGVIGRGEPDWNPRVEFQGRFRVFQETYEWPAIAIGFDSQGLGSYIEREGLERYEIKSKGFYAVASKNFELLGLLSLHGGVNQSLEKDDDDDVTFFVGLEKSVGDELSILGEYDAALNDDSEKSFGGGKGYLNLGVAWTVGERLRVEVNVWNILENMNEDLPDDLKERSIGSWSRGIRLTYMEQF